MELFIGELMRPSLSNEFTSIENEPLYYFILMEAPIREILPVMCSFCCNF